MPGYLNCRQQDTGENSNSKGKQRILCIEMHLLRQAWLLTDHPLDIADDIEINEEGSCRQIIPSNHFLITFSAFFVTSPSRQERDKSSFSAK